MLKGILDYIVIDIGKNDEEKWFSIQLIRKYRNIFAKIGLFGSLCGVTIIFYAILSGIMKSQINKLGLIIIFTIIFIIGYLILKYVYGTFFAWGIYIIKKKDLFANIDSSNYPVEYLINSYYSGGREYISVIPVDDIGLAFLFSFCIGIWLGMINSVIKFPECQRVKKHIKEKYKK